MTSSHQKPFLYELENGLPIPEGKLAYLEERARNRFYSYVLSKFLEKEETAGLTRAELGRRINKDPAEITRLLGAPGNWTIGTVAKLLAGIAAEEIEPHSRSLLVQRKRNYIPPESSLATRVDTSNSETMTVVLIPPNSPVNTVRAISDFDGSGAHAK